ncbi:hypothetical protein [Bradyrhizobium sp.]
MIRSDGADLGARPMPAGDLFWESPDIWLTGGDQYGNPVGGQPATVFARVWNLGTLVAAPVFVDFFFIAPSLGILPSAPKQIGVKSACVVVPPLSAVVVACPTPWIPPITGGGELHSCLLATCSAPITGDVPKVPFNPAADRHTAQHNYMVVEAGASKEMSFTLHLGNLEPRLASVELMAAASWRTHPKAPQDGFSTRPSVIGPVNAIRDSTKSNETRLWAQRAALVLERPEQAHQALRRDEVRQVVTLTAAKLGHIARSSAIVGPPSRFDTVGPSFTPLADAIELKALQQASATFSISVPESAPHPWLVVNLAQVSRGAIVGGYTVAVRTLRP